VSFASERGLCIVTNLSWRSKRVVRFYNGRGTAEQWIKAGKNAVKWTKAFLPHVQGQPGPLAVVRLGLQPGQLPAAAGLAETGATLVPDDAAGKADQDWGQGDAALQLRDVPTSGSGGDAELVRGDSQPHREMEKKVVVWQPAQDRSISRSRRIPLSAFSRSIIHR